MPQELVMSVGTKFSIPASMDPAKANELVAKAIHLSADEKAAVLAEYNAARGAAPKPAE